MTRSMFAMVTTQGTAMSETALCAAHYVEPFIGFARVVGEGAEDIGADTSFHDSTGNQELACVECGDSGEDDDTVYGACGVPNCNDCRPLFDASDNIIPGTE